MKILIDIPDRIHYGIEKGITVNGSEASQIVLDAVKNGTPLNDVLDKIRAEISCNIVEDDTSGNTPNRLRADWDAANKAHMIDIAILNRYKAEVRDKE